LLRHLLDRLPDTGRDVVHANVHRLNLPARSAAKRCGLGSVAAWWFVGLGSETGTMRLQW
jgi:hypothetical protein